MNRLESLICRDGLGGGELETVNEGGGEGEIRGSVRVRGQDHSSGLMSELGQTYRDTHESLAARDKVESQTWSTHVVRLEGLEVGCAVVGLVEQSVDIVHSEENGVSEISAWGIMTAVDSLCLL